MVRLIAAATCARVVFLQRKETLMSFKGPIDVNVHHDGQITYQFAPCVTVDERATAVDASHDLRIGRLLRRYVERLNVILAITYDLVRMINGNVKIRRLQRVRQAIRTRTIIMISDQLTQFTFLNDRRSGARQYAQPVGEKDNDVLRCEGVLSILQVRHVSIAFRAIGRGRQAST